MTDKITDAKFKVVDEPMVYSQGWPIVPKGMATFISGMIIFTAFYGAWHATNRLENMLAVALALYGVYFSRFWTWAQKPVARREMLEYLARIEARRYRGKRSSGAVARTD